MKCRKSRIGPRVLRKFAREKQCVSRRFFHVAETTMIQIVHGIIRARVNIPSMESVRYFPARSVTTMLKGVRLFGARNKIAEAITDGSWKKWQRSGLRWPAKRRRLWQGRLVEFVGAKTFLLLADHTSQADAASATCDPDGES